MHVSYKVSVVYVSINNVSILSCGELLPSAYSLQNQSLYILNECFFLKVVQHSPQHIPFICVYLDLLSAAFLESVLTKILYSVMKFIKRYLTFFWYSIDALLVNKWQCLSDNSSIIFSIQNILWYAVDRYQNLKFESWF